MLIQFSFFGAYFVFALPSGKLIEWIGYKKAMVGGLLTMGLGALLFVPAASAPSFPLFLAALIILAAGITYLAGLRESVRSRIGPGENGVEPPEFDASLQLPRHYAGSLVWQPTHSERSACGHRRGSGNVRPISYRPTVCSKRPPSSFLISAWPLRFFCSAWSLRNSSCRSSPQWNRMGKFTTRSGNIRDW